MQGVVSADAGREPARLGFAVIAALLHLYPTRFDFAATRNAIGSPNVWDRLAHGANVADAARVAARESAAVMRLREHYLIYGGNHNRVGPTDDATTP